MLQELMLQHLTSSLKTASEKDIRLITSLIERHGTREDMEIFKGISDVATINIDTLIKYGKAYLDDKKQQKKRPRQQSIEPRKPGFLTRMWRACV